MEYFGADGYDGRSSQGQLEHLGAEDLGASFMASVLSQSGPIRLGYQFHALFLL